MRGFDSISEYPSAAKSEQTQWDGLRDRRNRPLDFPDEWEKQERMFETIAPVANVYTVHGNHDLTNKNRKSNDGFTFPHKKSFLRSPFRRRQA